MHLLKLIILSMLTLSAFAKTECYVTMMEARALTFKLESAKKLRTDPSNEFTCTSYQTKRDYVQDGSKNRYIEASCGGKLRRLDIGSTFYSDDGKSYERLDTEYLCHVDYRRPTEKMSSELLKLKLNPSCSLRDSFGSDCYFPRSKPTLKAALIYYGSYWNEEDITRFKDVFTDRFDKATSGALNIEVVKTKSLPFRYPLPEKYSYNGITDSERLHRIWYWAEIGKEAASEAFWEYFYSETDKDELKGIDVLLTVTGAQEEGNGYAGGRVVVVEQPREIAWGGPGGGSTEILSDNQLADILVHETGHYIGLGHAVTKCDSEKIDLKKYPGGKGMSPSQQCCADSKNQNDVMSYCRSRDRKEINMFEACSLRYIKANVVPRILSGGSRKIEDIYKCE